MNKIVKILLISIALVGCGSVSNKMTNATKDIETGMPLTDFKKKLPNANMVQQEQNYACYRLRKSSAKFGEPGGYVYETRFFYFKDNKLYRIDEGTRATDLKIEIQNDTTVHSEEKNSAQTQQYIDVVYLKNGSIIKGMIIEQIPNTSLKIQTKDESVFVYKMDEVQKMTKELSK